MKKFFMIMSVIASVAITSCTTNAGKGEKIESVDSVAVAVDSVEVTADSLVVVTDSVE